MTRENKFFWKMVYCGIMLVLLVVIYFLARPLSISEDESGNKTRSGGKLATEMYDAGLADANLGKIDPASSAMKLGTFGMRGVAIALLWHQSQEFEKRKDWDNVIATSNQIMRLEPHFTTIWEFLGWKLAYNASAEFDDYRERYRWVIRGFDFLAEGIEVNQRSTVLNYKAGWTISQKIGIADEKVQYRRLLREDDAFHERYQTPGGIEERDNWLIGIRWYKEAENLYDNFDISFGKQAPPLIFSYSRMNRIHYAKWLADDGKFDDGGLKIRESWKLAEDEWRKYGQITFDTTIKRRDDPSRNYRASLLESIDNRERESMLISEMKSLQEGLFEELVLRHWNTTIAQGTGNQASLVNRIDAAETPEIKIVKEYLNQTDPGWKERFTKEREAILHADLGEENVPLLDIPDMFLSEQERTLVNEAQTKLSSIENRAFSMLAVSTKELADEMRGEKRIRAMAIIDELASLAEQTRMSELYRGIMNYPHWERLVVVEQQDESIKAREHIFNSRKAFRSSDLITSNDLWLKGLEQWNALINKPGFEDIAEDSQFSRDILDYVNRYVIILDELDRIFPPGFPLADMVYMEVSSDSGYKENQKSLEYVKKELEEGKTDSALEHLSIISNRLFNMKYSYEYLPLAPSPEIRDCTLEVAALYCETLHKTGTNSLPNDYPLKDYVQLMMQHDPIFGKDDKVIETAALAMRGILREENPKNERLEEVKVQQEKAFAVWKEIVGKYPILRFETAIPERIQLLRAIGDYQQILKKLGEDVPEDFPFRDFIKQPTNTPVI